jgi:hypothetical protein
MGAELKLADHEIPVSPVFITFLSQVLAHRPFEGEIWAHQLSEALLPSDGTLQLRATEAAIFASSLSASRLCSPSLRVITIATVAACRHLSSTFLIKHGGCIRNGSNGPSHRLIVSRPLGSPRESPSPQTKSVPVGDKGSIPPQGATH